MLQYLGISVTAKQTFYLFKLTVLTYYHFRIVRSSKMFRPGCGDENTEPSPSKNIKSETDNEETGENSCQMTVSKSYSP